jgi:tRNA (cmo5U34)-methyltransferase
VLCGKRPENLFLKHLRFQKFLKNLLLVVVVGSSPLFAGHFPLCMPTPTAPLPSPASPSAADFGPVARIYDALAGLAFGGALRRAQRAALAAGLPLGPALRVLVLGGGAGWVLTEIWRQRPQAQVLYVEVSAAMLARTRARLRRHPAPAGAAVELRQGTEAALRPDEQFDVVVTFFVLDCFTEAALPGALARLHAARAPGAPWLVTDFRPARRGWRHCEHSSCRRGRRG